MESKRRTIEIDEDVAVALEQRAAERGQSLDDVLSGWLEIGDAVRLEPDDLAELQARMDQWERDRLGAPAQEVFAWMRSWGSDDEFPEPRPRRL